MQAEPHTRQRLFTFLNINDGRAIYHILHPRERNSLWASCYYKGGTDPKAQITVASIGETLHESICELFKSVSTY